MALIEFVRARLADDEDAASRADDHEWAESANQMRWHRARVLAEVEAKRRIVDGLADADPHGGYITATFTAEDVLRLLALPYADHPDYDPKWRP